MALDQIHDLTGHALGPWSCLCLAQWLAGCRREPSTQHQAKHFPVLEIQQSQMTTLLNQHINNMLFKLMPSFEQHRTTALVQQFQLKSEHVG